MFYVTISGLTGTVEGKMPLSAAEALAIAERSKQAGASVQIKDRSGNLVSIEDLRIRAGEKEKG